ncbi:unnamed protein product, partial [Prorocentrum cordatum]
ASLAKVAPYINETIAKFRDGDCEALKAKSHELIEQLLANDLAVKAVHDCKEVGVHCDNRDGIGIEVPDVHVLIQRICQAGWDPRVPTAIAFERPDGPQGKKMMDFNLKLIADSDGHLAPLIDHEVKIFSVSSSHTVAGHRCVRHGSLTTLSDTFSTDSRLAAEKIKQRFPAYRSPLEDGMTWVVIRRQVEQACPQLPDFIQASENAGHGVEQAASKLQVMKRIHSRATANQKSSGEPCWEKIARSIEQQSHHMAGQAMDVCHFVKAYSGGDPPVHLNDLDNWSKTLKWRRDIHGSTFKFLAATPFSQGPEYIFAVLKAMMVAPEQAVRDGFSRLFTSTDVAAIVGSKKGLAIKIVTYIRTGREWLDKSSIPPSKKLKIRGDFEVAAVMFAHNKKAKGRPIYNNIEEVAASFIQAAFDADPELRNSTLPWPHKETPAVARATGSSMVQFGGEGVGPETLEQCGIQIGSELELKMKDSDESKGSKDTFKLVAIKGSTATLEKACTDKQRRQAKQHGEGKVTISIGQLVDEYKALF